MELKEIADKFLQLCGCKTFSELPQRLMSAVMNNETDIYQGYLKLCPDLKTDWLQKIYQFYLADREEKKQDFTPSSLAKLLSTLTHQKSEQSVYDCCAGSGALTIQKWSTNKHLRFVCEEIDDNVIPFLLFNLSVRNINGSVIHGNVLTQSIKSIYQVKAGKPYGTISRINQN